jgi:hypothetical protein
MVKSFESIKKDADTDDYRFIASCFQLSVETVRKIVSEHRTDKHRIQQAFTILHQSKQQSLSKALAKINKLKEKSLNSDTINNTDGTKS